MSFPPTARSNSCIASCTMKATIGAGMAKAGAACACCVPLCALRMCSMATRTLWLWVGPSTRPLDLAMCHARTAESVT